MWGEEKAYEDRQQLQAEDSKRMEHRNEETMSLFQEIHSHRTLDVELCDEVVRLKTIFMRKEGNAYLCLIFADRESVDVSTGDVVESLREKGTESDEVLIVDVLADDQQQIRQFRDHLNTQRLLAINREISRGK